MSKRKSLKSRILVRLGIPLIVFICIEAGLSYQVTLYYVNKTYDRWLLDSANSLAQEIKVRHAKVLIELPVPALEIVRWDELDKTYFKITSATKGLLSGDAFVPEPQEPTDWGGPVFQDAVIGTEPVRVVSMQVHRPDISDTFSIHVAETLKKRRTMMADILVADLAPFVVMILLTAILLLISLSKGLKPLNVLANEVTKRSPRDLSPIADTYVLTEISTLTDTINGLLERLSAGIAGQQRFVANAAHQLRTPLAGLMLQAENALHAQDLTDIKPALQQIHASAARLSHTIKQLLILAKSEPVDGLNELNPLDISKITRTTCMEWATYALDKGIEISLECPDQPVIVPGDETLLRELLANLLDNAIEYGHDNGRIKVKLSKTPPVSLIVEDDGPGIPAEEIPKVLERFYRLPDSPGNGCGLGLAIVKDIADLHQARLELNNIGTDKGTRVTVIFTA